MARRDATICFLSDAMETYKSETVAVGQMAFSRDVRAETYEHFPLDP